MTNSLLIDTDSPKAQQILKGARDVFFELGYDGASTSQIARQAKVSKGTLYNYFPDKKSLFITFIEEECHKQAAEIFEVQNQKDDIEAVLREVTYNYVKLLASPFIQNIYRLVIAEATRFPTVARTFYDSGPALAARRLTQLLAAADARGELHVKDLDLAAHHLAQLCRSDLFEKCLFQVKRKVTSAEIERVSENAVEAFLAIYR